MALIELRDVYKSFGDKHVLRGITIDVQPGEMLVILGGSGTGKSVTLKLMVGLLRADRGEIIFDGKNITSLKEKEYYPVRKRASYLFQGGALFDSMTVFGNLAYPLKEHTKMSNREIMPLVRESLDRVELQDIEHLYPSDLSGGMMKRVALARAIINKPELVLYDEPTTGLDPLTTRTINRLIRKMQNDLKITSVVVTHDMSTARYVADRLAFLDEGQLAFLGTMEEAARSDHKLLRAYLEGDSHE
jgi:phospholipid/cholesterol/gamma-HCH transport system ATP-binding protein